jgi:hypothetical protein
MATLDSTEFEGNDAEDSGSYLSASESDGEDPVMPGLVHHWTVEGPVDFILIMREWPHVTCNVLVQETGFRVDWTVSEPDDSLLSRASIPIKEAHKSVKPNSGTFFVQAPRRIESAHSLIRCHKEREWKVIFAAWKESDSTQAPIFF